MKIKEKAKEYFKLFEKGNDIGLSEMYDDEIQLIDWGGSYNGKEDVLSMNRELFESSKISVTIRSIEVGMSPAGFPSNRVYCKIYIQINNDMIKVMDVIDFNEEGKITKIEAYKG
mgnify:CR=1 FL=1|tara:strand:+ start:612 stop:956 length:345 start_codon:yes stop_codon:yes gene_type:complete